PILYPQPSSIASLPICAPMSYDDAGVTTALGAAIMKTTTPSIEGGEPPRGNAHDVSERGRAIMRRLKARAAAKGLPAPDLTGDLDLRRRIYRAARRIEDARVRRGDTRPFLLDEEPALTAFLSLPERDIAAGCSARRSAVRPHADAGRRHARGPGQAAAW
ncbi:hypothetical protein, partial [Azospirillum griseum]